MITVFVYGTLMGNRANHRFYLKNQRYLGQAVLPGHALYDLGSFPGTIADPTEKVRGELYEINSQCLRQLDQLEGNGSLYVRETVMVRLGDEKREAQVYIWNGQIKAENKVAWADQPWTAGIRTRR